MLRLTQLLLFFATIQVGKQAPYQLKRWGNMSIAVIDRYLYWVTKNVSHINIHTNKALDLECDLELNEPHVGTIQVAAIERKILLLYRHNSTGLRMLQLDPFLCFYVPLPSIRTTVISIMDPQIVIANNSLNVFLRGASDCLPCRFDVNGNQLEVPGQLEKGNDILVRSFILKEFVHENNGLNYAFAANFKNGSSVLRHLDHYFNTAVEVHFKYHQIEAVAVNWSPVKTWIGITYAGLGSPHERILALYTGSLELLFETRLTHPASYELVDTMLSINSTGHLLVSSVHTEPPPYYPDRSWRNAIYSPVGQLVETDHIYGRFQKYDWQMFRRCAEGSCLGDTCTGLNAYYEDQNYRYTTSTVSCK